MVGVSELPSLKTYQVSMFCNWFISRKMLFTNLTLLYKKYFLGCIFSWVSLFICATKSSMKSPWLISSSYYACFSLLFFVLPYLSKKVWLQMLQSSRLSFYIFFYLVGYNKFCSDFTVDCDKINTYWPFLIFDWWTLVLI